MKKQKQGVQKASQQNMMFERIFGAKMGGLGKPKQAFRIVLVAIYEVSLDHEIYKICTQKPAKQPKLGPRAPKGNCFMIR